MQLTLSTFPSPYPVRLEGHLERPSRGLWLIKWLLVIPHAVILMFLWMGFAISALAAFVVILFTGRYPRALFDYNVGVMRWSWRVRFYSFAANGTDRYPPFSLEDVPDYPARLEIDYPEHQRRGWSLIGWWLAGIPQYIVAGVFIGGGGVAGWTASTRSWGGATWMGLISLLVFFAVLVLLVRGQYPRSIFDFVLGLNRWVMRVMAYAALMTPEYPPFRVDAGESDPAGTLTVGRTETQPTVSAAEPRPWGPGRIVGLALSSLGCLIAAGLIAAGGTGIALDQSARNPQGYLMTPTGTFSTGTYALVSASYRGGGSGDWFVMREILGKVRIQAQSAHPLFVGIASERAVNAYLATTAYAHGSRFETPSSDFRVHQGGAPSALPASQTFWAASATGSGTQTLTWTPSQGNWRIVVMNADAASGVSADVSVGATIPHLLTIAVAALGGGILLLMVSVGGVVMSVRRAR